MDILPCFSAYGLCGFEQGEVFSFLAPESYHVTLCLTFCTAFKAVHGFHTVDHEFIALFHTRESQLLLPVRML